MRRLPRPLPALVLALALAACRPPGLAGAGDAPLRPPGPSASPERARPPAAGGTIVGADGATITLDAAMLIGLDGGSLRPAAGAHVTGRVLAPAGLIGQDGGSLVGNSGNTLITQTKAPVPLTGVRVYMRTADGRFHADADGRPIAATTDADGRFELPGYRLARGVVAFVPTRRAAGELQGLAAIVPLDRPADGPLAIDLASTLTAGWLLERVLPAVPDGAAGLDRFTASLDAELRAEAARALAGPADGPAPALASLARPALASAVDGLRATSRGLEGALERARRAVTLAGADNTAGGRDARAITLQQPVDVAVAPDGTLYVAELLAGLVRRVDADGRTTIVLGPGSPSEARLGALQPTDVVVGPDGDLYVASRQARAVYRVSPDGTRAEPVLGGGGTPAAPGVPATEAVIAQPGALAFDATGALLVGEADMDPRADGRLLRLAPGGALEVLPNPWGDRPSGADLRGIVAIAVAPDGAWWCLERELGELWRRPAGGAWTRVAAGLTDSRTADLLAEPDGAVLVSSGVLPAGQDHAIERIAPDGTRTRVAGGEPGGGEADVATGAARFSGPAGLARRADGAVLVADLDNGLVRALATDGRARVVAGVAGAADALPLDAPLNVPAGLAIDGRGRVVVTEFAGHAIRRLEGDALVRIAGGRPGRAGTGDLAPADALYGPAGIAFRGDDLVLAEQSNHLIRRLTPDGRIETLAGGGTEPLDRLPAGVRPGAREPLLENVLAVAVSPAGVVHFAETNVVWRLAADGRLERVAGTYGRELPPAERDGTPALSARLGRVAALAFDPAGDLYAAEMETCQVVKIDRAGTLTVVAGAGLGATIAALASSEPPAEDGVPAREAALLLPSGLAFDAAGRLHIAEVGTRGAQLAKHVALGQLPVADGRIRVVGADGRIRPLVGPGAPGAGRVRNPIGLVIAPDGRIYFADAGSNQVKAL